MMNIRSILLLKRWLSSSVLVDTKYAFNCTVPIDRYSSTGRNTNRFEIKNKIPLVVVHLYFTLLVVVLVLTGG